MDKRELIERYVYAVTKHMKADTRADVSKELESIIQDMLEERCGEGVPTEADVRIVLAEMGTPAQLAQKYDEDSDKCLIGAPYYRMYLEVLKIVAVCVAGGMLIAQMIAGVINHEEPYVIAVDLIGGICGGLTSAFAIVTMIFAVFYHKKVKMNNIYDTIDNLPPVPKKTEKISKADAIGGMVISILFTIVFLCCPQIFCMVDTELNMVVPIFNLDYIRETAYFVLLFAGLGLIRDFVKLFDGRYTIRLMIVTIVTNVLTAILTFIWMSADRIINPDFPAAMVRVLDVEPNMPEMLFSQFNYFLPLVILFALTIDTICVVINTLKSQH